MVDTAGYGGRTVSPMSGLNRTNDNILLYTALYCTDVLMSCTKHYKNTTVFLLKDNGKIRTFPF